VDNGGLDNYIQFVVLHYSYHIAMLDNRADPLCMIEGADTRAVVDNSPYDVGDNSQGLSLKYQRGASRSLVSPTCKQINAAMP
jgi:hypothetical protein